MDTHTPTPASGTTGSGRSISAHIRGDVLLRWLLLVVAVGGRMHAVEQGERRRRLCWGLQRWREGVRPQLLGGQGQRRLRLLSRAVSRWRGLLPRAREREELDREAAALRVRPPGRQSEEDGRTDGRR